jgi:glucose/arabinose dehydrogenase
MITTSKLRSVMAQQSIHLGPALQAAGPWHPAPMLRLGAALVLVGAALVAACGGSGANGETGTGGGSTAASESATGAGSGETGSSGSAASGARGVRLVKIGDFASPLYVTAPPGDRRRIFVVEQAGRIVVVRGGKRLAQPFLDIRSNVTAGGEQGLLSMAFAPDYAQSGRFYVYYTERSGTEAIWEYRRASEDRADAGSARLVLRMADPEPNHNGGMMVFGSDGLMYVGTGDGGGGDDQHGARGNAQSLGSLLGKILRIDPRQSGSRPYTVPSSNPFVGRSGVRAEIYAYGLRNPWRFSFDRATGDLSIADVGQDAVEEVDFVRNGRGRGANFGWRPWEGRSRNFDEPAPGAIFPVIAHTHGEGFCSITGGYIVRDRGVPALYGRYVYGDFCESRIRAATLRVGRRLSGKALPLPRVEGLSSFGEDAVGRVYATSLNGPVYRLAAR